VIPTYIGILEAFVGFWLLTQPIELSVAFFAYCTLLGGASAIDVDALGGASIPPANFALLFLLCRLWRQDLARSEALLKSVVANRMLIIYCFYSAAMAFVLPKLFAGKIVLVPMGTSSLGPMLLTPTSQNITTAVYMLGTAIAAVAVSMTAISSQSFKLMEKTFIVITWVHVATGVLDLILNTVHLGFLLFIVRNGHYAQLDQNLGDFHRISGIMPEPSVYATFGGVCLVLMSEFWLRNIRPRASGWAAVAMLVMLVAATSSTGYIYIAVYGVCLWLRLLFVPGTMGSKKIAMFLLLHVVGVCGALLVAVFKPHLVTKVLDALQSVTLGKATSESGLQRAEWVRQGLTAMMKTGGLGVGVGSFRSSSIITAILGSVGPVALIVFLIYVFQVWQPWRKSTFKAASSEELSVAAAAGWGALMMIVAEAAVAPSPDPGIMFGLLGGLAIGLRLGKLMPRQVVRQNARLQAKTV
jgi:hypothetical protein